MTSVALPAVRGTIRRIGFVGQAWAQLCVDAPAGRLNEIAAASNQRRGLMLDMGVLERLWFEWDASGRLRPDRAIARRGQIGMAGERLCSQPGWEGPRP